MAFREDRCVLAVEAPTPLLGDDRGPVGIGELRSGVAFPNFSSSVCGCTSNRDLQHEVAVLGRMGAGRHFSAETAVRGALRFDIRELVSGGNRFRYGCPDARRGAFRADVRGWNVARHQDTMARLRFIAMSLVPPVTPRSGRPRGPSSASAPARAARNPRASGRRPAARTGRAPRWVAARRQRWVRGMVVRRAGPSALGGAAGVPRRPWALLRLPARSAAPGSRPGPRTRSRQSGA
jgi:hypothetical protein